MLSDLGAGEAAQSPRLAELGITMSILAGVSMSSPHAGSLLYMAPEVIAGEMPTQRSDVFELGVLVYQLVVGDLRRSLAPGWEADVADPLLSQDIALAAAANPERRLIDARALGERLHSLEARRTALAAERERELAATHQSEQLVRLTQRRRQLIAGSMVLAAVLAVSVWQQRQTAQARAHAEASARRAEAEAAKTRGVVDFLTEGVLKQADPYSGNSGAVTLRQAINNAAKEIDSRFRDTPDVAAAIHGTLGAAYEGMNDYDKAAQHYRKQLAGLRGTSPVDRIAIAKTHGTLCTASLWQGDLTQAVPECQRARSDFLAAGLAPDRTEVFLALADTREGRYKQALARLQPRMERIRASSDHDLYGFAQTFTAVAYAGSGDIARMERARAEAVEARRRQNGANGGMLLAWALADHGQALLLLGREEEGRERLEQAARMFDKIAGPHHPQNDVPRIHLAAHELALGRWQAARALAKPTHEALLKETGWQHWTIYAALTTMVAEAELGNSAAAYRLFSPLASMAIEHGMEKNFPYMREPHWTAFAAMHLALGEFDRAEHYLGRLRELVRDPDPSPLLVARVECIEAGLLQARGALAAARASAQACRNRIVTSVSERSPLVTLADRLLAELDSPAGKAAAASSAAH